MGCLKIHTRQIELTPLKVVYPVDHGTGKEVRTLQKVEQSFTSVDPLADAPANIGTSPYAYVLNNPINMIDPDGRAAVDVDDWVETSSGAIVYDAAVTDRASAQERYGTDAKYLGKEATIMGSDGTQISLNANGHMTSSAWLDKIDNGGMVTISASRIESTSDKASTASSAGTYALGTYMAMSDKADAITNSLNSTAKSLGKYGGGAMSAVSIFSSAKSVYENPSPGRVFSLAYDITASRQRNPYVMVGMAGFDLFGGKEEAARALDQTFEFFI